MPALSVLTAVARARWAGLLRIRPADAPLAFNCLGKECGLCCEVTGGAVVTEKSPRCGRAKILGAVGGRCNALSNGQCAIYASRPRGCREYPWYNVGGRLHYDIGCPGVSPSGDDRPDASTIAAIESYYLLPRWLRAIAIWLILRW